MRAIGRYVMAAFRQHALSNRSFSALLLLASYAWIVTDNLRGLTVQTGYQISYAIVPMVMASPMVSIIYYIGWLLLVSNLPFRDIQQFHYLIRLGKKRWFLGQMGYILVMSLLYSGLAFGIFLVVLWPALGFYSDWGSIFRTYAVGGNSLIGVTLGSLYVSFDAAVMSVQPAFYVVMTLGMIWLLTYLVGVIILLGNYGFKNMGLVLATVGIFFQLFKFEAMSALIHYLAVLSWPNIVYYATRSDERYPSLMWILAGIGILVSLLVAGVRIYASQSRDIRI